MLLRGAKLLFSLNAQYQSQKGKLRRSRRGRRFLPSWGFRTLNILTKSRKYIWHWRTVQEISLIQPNNRQEFTTVHPAQSRITVLENYFLEDSLEAFKNGTAILFSGPTSKSFCHLSLNQFVLFPLAGGWHLLTSQPISLWKKGTAILFSDLIFHPPLFQWTVHLHF